MTIDPSLLNSDSQFLDANGTRRWNRQQASPLHSERYPSVFERIEVATPSTRRWPSRRITEAPLWVPVDLRDGNQALAEPMDAERKRQLFQLLVDIGYKEIEVGYPAASQADFDFVRLIARERLAPEDVTIVVFAPARRELIDRTIESIAGITGEVVVHLYTPTAPAWRELVLGLDQQQLADLIVDSGRRILELVGDAPNIRFEFSPESVNVTEPEYAIEVCNRMVELWDARPERPVIINLPSTVEVSTPNVFADLVEYFDEHLLRREHVILSVHPHNDRGTGVASAELALLAGAQRVEGCLFGNGERTGNVDLITLALNLHTQGVDPRIDLSDIDKVRRVVEHATRMQLHPRHPYAGDLVHTAFSGSHQDAIKKGFAEHRERAGRLGVPEREAQWRVPYLPVDPADLGRTYDAIIRVNSQSGKGGIAYLLLEEYGLDLPRRLQIDFSKRVQRVTDASGEEVSAQQLWQLFQREYLAAPAADADAAASGPDSNGEANVELVEHWTGSVLSGEAITYLEYRRDGETGWIAALGATPAESLALATERARANHRPAPTRHH